MNIEQQILKIKHIKSYICTLVTISRPDSNNICNPRVAITDAKITIPCQMSFCFNDLIIFHIMQVSLQKYGYFRPESKEITISWLAKTEEKLTK